MSLFVSVLVLSGCESYEPLTPETASSGSSSATDNTPSVVTIDDCLNSPAVLFSDDDTEWSVVVVREHIFFPYDTLCPPPFRLPTKEEAGILRKFAFVSEWWDGSERFVTSDGYTFGCPSSSVTKAGSKTRYSVMGLYRRPLKIEMQY